MRFNDLSPEEQAQVLQREQQAAAPPALGPGMDTGPTEIQTTPPAAVEFAKKWLVPAVAIGGGAALGAMSPVPGGAFIGAGLGNMAADEINRRIAEYYNMPTRGWTPGTAAESFGTGVAAEAGGRVLPYAAGRAFLGTGRMGEALAGAEEERGGMAGALNLLHEQRDEAITNAAVTAAERQKQIQSALTKERGPRAAQQELERFLGRTPEESRMLPEVTRPDWPVQPQWAQQMRDRQKAIVGAWGDGQRVWNKEYTALLSKHLDRPMAPDTIREAAQTQLDWAEGKGVQLAPQVKTVLERAAKLGVAEEGAPAVQAATAEAAARVPAAGGTMSVEQYRAMQAGAREAEPITVGQVKGLWQQASGLSSKGFAGPQGAYNNAVMGKLAQAIEDSLERAGVPKSAELNAGYRAWKQVFDPATINLMHNVWNARQLGPLFRQAEGRLPLVVDFFRKAPPERRVILEEMFADWVHTAGPNGRPLLAREVGEQVGADNLAALMPRKEMGKLRFWLTHDAKAATWDAVRQSDPAAETMLQEQYRDELRGIRMNMATQMRNAAVTQLRKLGPTGVTMAEELQGMTPLAAEVKLQQHFTQGRLSLEAVSQQARQDALKNLGKKDPFLERFLWRSGFAVPMAMGSMVVGGVPRYALGMMALGTMLAPALGSRQVMRAMLRHPEVADFVIREMGKEPTQMGVKMMGRWLARLTAADAGHALEEKLGAGPAAPEQPAQSASPPSLWSSGTNKQSVLDHWAAARDAQDVQGMTQAHAAAKRLGVKMSERDKTIAGVRRKLRTPAPQQQQPPWWQGQQ